MSLWNIAEIISFTTNTYSDVFINKKNCWRTSGVLDWNISFEDYIRINIAETLKIYHLDKPMQMKDVINVIWELATYYFICTIETCSSHEDMSQERDLLKKNLQDLLFRLLNHEISKQNIKPDWIDWQYNFNGLCKDTPKEKSQWLENRLQALRTMIESGKCPDEYFTYVLYLLLTEKALRFFKPKEESSGCIREDELIAVKRLARFAAYIENKEQFFQNFNNYLVDYFYWFLRYEHPYKKELDTWGDQSKHTAHSCAHGNGYGDLYTVIESSDEFCFWIRLMAFFDVISIDETYVFLRCFGQIFPGKNETDSTFFANKCKNFFSKDISFYKENPGYVFCMYWMIHYLDLNAFKNVFQNNESILPQDDFCKKNGIIPVSEPTFQKDCLEKLQLLTFFVLFDLSSKFMRRDDYKDPALAPLMKLFENKTWHRKTILIETFNNLERKAGIQGTPLNIFLSDFMQGNDSIESSIILVSNMTKFFRDGTQWLVCEVNHIKELKDNKFYIPEYNQLKNPKKNFSDSEKKDFEKHQTVLAKIDKGLTIYEYTQKIPQYKNLFISRQVNVRLFLDSVSNINDDDDWFFRNQYRSLIDNKFAYLDRNMYTHFAAFSKVKDLFYERNFPDLLTALYDLNRVYNKIEWKVLDEKIGFSSIPQASYYKTSIQICLDSMLDYISKRENTLIKDIFDSNGHLTIDRNTLKTKGKDFMKGIAGKKNVQIPSEFKELKQILNVLYCNSEICRKVQTITENGNVKFDEYPEYKGDFWLVYRYEIATYLIKVAIQLIHYN